MTDEALDVNLEGATQSDSDSTSGQPALPARHRQTQHTANTGGRRRKDRRIKVSIVGSSLVCGLGNAVNDNDFDVCCKCFPGGKIENIAPQLPKVTRENDDVIVIAAGSNNIPSHDVATIIRRAGEMFDDLRYTRPNKQLVIPAIPRRYDDPDQSDVYRDKIERVNIFLEHKCKKNPKFHFLRHNFRFVDYKTDGLHFNQAGVEKYTANIKAVIKEMHFDNE